MHKKDVQTTLKDMNERKECEQHIITVLILFIRRFCAAWFKYRAFRHFITEEFVFGDKIAFATQMASRSG